eukprot:CAMPEP_0170119542 /NCGR_PEP_ID=MMETSP0020_2-20130122/14467_1 /TAXON_ID=98059 /ORGANISM="Dinobryon sp., Strain UTEXLB2267" /LENGTH=77 /DNA_ID=CAMNT_0010348951 /DNA_START=338 /DNA_END=571 /DNA_ORIENTATION=-
MKAAQQMAEKTGILLVDLKDLKWAAMKAALMVDMTALLMAGKMVASTAASMVDLKALMVGMMVGMMVASMVVLMAAL